MVPSALAEARMLESPRKAALKPVGRQHDVNRGLGTPLRHVARQAGAACLHHNTLVRGIALQVLGRSMAGLADLHILLSRLFSARNVVRIMTGQAGHLRLLEADRARELVRRMRCLEAEVLGVLWLLKVSLVLSQRLARTI